MLGSPNLVFGALLAVCLALLVRWTTTPGFRFSPALLFFFIFTLQQAIGCMGLVDEADPRERLARLGLALGILGFTLGVGAANVWARFDPRELAGVRSRFEFTETHLPTKVGIMALGYVVSVAILAFSFHQSGGIPLFQGIAAFVSGDEVRMAQQLLREKRMEMTYFETSSYRGQGYLDQIRMVALPYIAPCFIIWAVLSRRKLWMFAAAIATMPVLVFLLGTGQRHPVAAFLLTGSIVGYIVSTPAQHKRLLGSFAAVGFVVFFIMTYLLGRYTHTDDFRQDLLMVLWGIWNRIAYSNAYGTMALFDLFPNPEPFRWGMTWLRDLQGFLPGPYVAFSAWLYRRLYGAVGTAAPMCFGEMYANFGLIGVAVGGACLGLFLQTLQIHWARMPRIRVQHVVLYGLLSMAFMRWGMGGLLAPIQHGAIGLPLLQALVAGGQQMLLVLAWRLRIAGSTLARRVGAASVSKLF